MTTPREIMVASFEGVMFLDLATAAQLGGKELGAAPIAKLNTAIDWTTIGRVFQGLHSAHIAADPDDRSGGEQKCFVVVNLIFGSKHLQPERCPVPEDILAAIADELCAGREVDDWECVESELVTDITAAELSPYAVLLPWASSGEMDDEEGTYYTVVNATSEKHAVRLAAEEMADNGEKVFSDRAARLRYVRTRCTGFSAVSSLVDRVRSDIEHLFGSNAGKSARLDALRSELLSVLAPEVPNMERPRGG